MSIAFVKYQGTGNDFVIIDARQNIPSGMDVSMICDRHYGIGADGLMLLTEENGYDFGMIYYNSDGNISSMCGNGGRCIAHFADSLGLGNSGKLQFLAIDGPHQAHISGENVRLQMIDVKQWEIRDYDTVVLNTGSPHFVRFTETDPEKLDLLSIAHSIRYSDEFSSVGINVNFVKSTSGNLDMRTYERGVEDETLSCGTGVTAAALASHILYKNSSPITVKTPGGILSVSFDSGESGYSNIWLQGPAKMVFRGEI
jgi:diaminopimelate epimerase